MYLKTLSTYQKFGVPDKLINTIFVLLLILLIAPYGGGLDFGIFKVPVLPLNFENLLKWLAPFLLFIYVLLFIPFWKVAAETIQESEDKKPEPVHPSSKYILQSTPDIILNELQKSDVNTDGIKIVSGFNINDLKKRIKILNLKLSNEKITTLVESARKIAFSSKYAAPKEDEKLENINDLKVEGIAEWQIYLKNFLLELGISGVVNIEVIDVGIGNAYASLAFLKECTNLTGVDISQEAIKYAKDKLHNAKIKIGSAENLKDIESFSVDLYISLRTYQSTLFDVKESLHEAYRVLAKGGGIVISIPAMYLKKDNNGKIISVLKGLIPQGSSVPSFEYAMQVSEKIEGYLKILGFRDVIIGSESPFEIYIGARK